MILTLTLNPAIDVALRVQRFDFAERAFIESETETAGGKGINGARLVRAYGGDALAVAPVGGRNGRRFEELLREAGVPAALVPVAGETRRNLAISDRRGATLKLDQPGQTPARGELDLLESAVRERLPGATWLLLAGSIAPGTPPDVYGRFVRRAREAGAMVLLDSSGSALPPALAQRPALAKPNRAEAADLLGRAITGIEDAARSADDIRGLGAERVVLSLGESRGGRRRSGRALARRAAPDPRRLSGGRGAMSSRRPCAWAMERGEPFAEALRRGVAAATLAASLPGLEFGSLDAAEAMCRRVSLRSC